VKLGTYRIGKGWKRSCSPTNLDKQKNLTTTSPVVVKFKNV